MFFARFFVIFPVVSVGFMAIAGFVGVLSAEEDRRLFVVSAIVTLWAVSRLQRLSPDYTPLSVEIRAALQRRRERRRGLLEQTPGLGKTVRLPNHERPQDWIDV